MTTCFYLLQPDQKNKEEHSRWYFAAYGISFWMMGVGPLIYYLNHEINHIHSSLVIKILQPKLEKIKYLVWITYTRIIVRTIFNIFLIIVWDFFNQTLTKVLDQALNFPLLFIVYQLLILEGEKGDNHQKFVEVPGRSSLVESQDDFDQIQEMSDFRKNFTLDQLERRSTIDLHNSLRTIYMILLGLSGYFKNGEESIKCDEFVKQNPEMSVDKIELDHHDSVTITEFEPEIFKGIRDAIIEEKILLQSIIPSANFQAMHNF